MIVAQLQQPLYLCRVGQLIGAHALAQVAGAVRKVLFVAAKHPKSFVSLSGSDHLLSNRRDSGYVADLIAAWAERYIEPVAGQSQ